MNSVRRLVGAALVVASLAVATTPALASGRSTKPTTSRAPSVTSVAAAVAAYRATMASIDAEFSRTVARANHALALAMKRAKTSADRINARFVFRQAIVRATARREIEVEALDSSSIGQIDLGSTGAGSDGGSSNGDH